MSANTQEINYSNLIKAAILGREIYYPLLDAKLQTSRNISETIFDIWFTYSPFERVLKGEKYEDVEKDILNQEKEFYEGLERIENDGAI